MCNIQEGKVERGPLEKNTIKLIDKTPKQRNNNIL